MFLFSQPLKKMCDNLIDQQRQYQRRQYLEKKRTLRKIVQMGKLLEEAGFACEDRDVIYGLLREAKEKLQSKEANTIRLMWRMKALT